jgi:hypothetical protein
MYDDGFVSDWTEEDREECLGPIHEDDWPTDEEIYEATPDYPGKQAWPF